MRGKAEASRPPSCTEGAKSLRGGGKRRAGSETDRPQSTAERKRLWNDPPSRDRRKDSNAGQGRGGTRVMLKQYMGDLIEPNISKP